VIKNQTTTFKGSARRKLEENRHYDCEFGNWETYGRKRREGFKREL